MESKNIRKRNPVPDGIFFALLNVLFVTPLTLCTILLQEETANYFRDAHVGASSLQILLMKPMQLCV
jgi:hypothetical protein